MNVKKIPVLISITTVLLFMLLQSVHAQTVFMYRSPEDVNDKRYEYDTKILKLALDLTVDKYGPYTLKPSPVMNYVRALHMAEIGALPNFFMKNSYETRLGEKLDFVPIPVDRGIVGYRVCFVSNKNKKKVADVSSIDDLKKLTFVQGSGWSDVEILRRNGFNVVTISNYEAIFQFTAEGKRADIFCRGINEILNEYKSYKEKSPDLEIDETFILYYPLPRFFFTTKGNTQAVARIKEGLDIAWKNGSFVKLWEEQYRESIDFVKPEKRKVFSVPNHLITDFDPEDLKKYYYSPFTGK